MVKLTKKQVNRKLTAIQSSAEHAVIEAFCTSDRAACIMACSTGKSRVCERVIRRYQGNVSVICVPNLQLVQQFIGTITKVAAMKGHTILPVCSEIGNESPEDFDIRGATTDKASILAVCRGKQPVIVVVTYQSFHVLASAIQGKVPVDLLVADEAHRTAGIHGKYFGECLHDTALSVRKRLFMTATPVVYRGQNEDVCLMSDPAIYGDVAFEYSYRDACEDGVVAPVRMFVLSVPTEGAADAANTLGLPKHQALLAETLYRHSLKPRQRTKMLVFHNSVKISKAFTQKLRLMGVAAEHLNGDDTVAYRQQKIQEFSEAKGPCVICSVRVFSEGVDAPAIDTIVFAEKKGAAVDIQQCTGRGTRWSEQKNFLKVIIPYFTRQRLKAKLVQEELLASTYGPLANCLTAMATMEGSLTDYRVSPKGEDKKDASEDDPGFRDTDEADTELSETEHEASGSETNSPTPFDGATAEASPISGGMTMVKNLPIIKVTIFTDEGEFDAEDVRRKYVAFMQTRWARSRAGIIKQAREIFGPTRPDGNHPKYKSFLQQCDPERGRPFKGKEILDAAFPETKSAKA